MDVEDLGLPEGFLADITGERLEVLLQLMAVVSEKSYRRGFQQGHWAANDDRPLVDLWAWRFTHTLHEAPSPHQNGPTTFSLQRLRGECGGELDYVLKGP